MPDASPPETPRRVLITGATGVLGPTIVRAFADAGHRVRTLSLDAPTPGMFPPNVEIREGDINDAPTVRVAMQDVDWVIHLAALLHIENPPSHWRERYEHINVHGTATIVDAARAANVSRVIMFSTIAVYGPTNGRIVNEDTPPAPDTIYAETKYAAERIVLQATRIDGTPLGIVLRLGAVYGARVKGNYLRLLRALAHHRFVPLGKGTNRRTLIYVEDVARAALLAAQHPNAIGKVYNVTDGRIHPLHEILAAMCCALGQSPPRLYIPVSCAQQGIQLWQTVNCWIGRSTGISRATLAKYLEDAAVDGSRIQRELGFVPQFDLATGWRVTIEEMKQLGLL